MGEASTLFSRFSSMSIGALSRNLALRTGARSASPKRGFGGFIGKRAKPFRGVPFEGWLADWYDRNAARHPARFQAVAHAVIARVPQGGHVLDLAPGPGRLAIEIAKESSCQLTGLDISHSFVRIARRNAERAGVSIDFQHGDAAHMPFGAASFDYIVCTAAFKNFSDPMGVLDEMHRVLRPGGRASIHDIWKEATAKDIDNEVRPLAVSPLNAFIRRWIFRRFFLRHAYSRNSVERLAAQSGFSSWELLSAGVGFELRLTKAFQAEPSARSSASDRRPTNAGPQPPETRKDSGPRRDSV